MTHASSPAPSRHSPHAGTIHDQAIAALSASLDRLRYGTIAMRLHEGRIIQIDVTERFRVSG